MKFITPTVHVIIDYFMVVFMALAPNLFNLDTVPSTILYVMAAGYGLVTLMTNSPSAPIHVIPFKVHGGLELLGAIFMLAAPWAFGFSDQETARNLFLTLGVLTLLTFACTQWRETPHHRHSPA